MQRSTLRAPGAVVVRIYAKSAHLSPPGEGCGACRSILSSGTLPTMETFLKAAETGHLVLSILHTNDAPRTIQRILNVFELSEHKELRIRLCDSLKAIVSQRLLPRTNKKGRVAVFEIMRATLSIQECIKNENKTVGIRDLIARGRDQYGMQTFDQHLMELYNSKIINLASARSAASSATDFDRDVQFT